MIRYSITTEQRKKELSQLFWFFYKRWVIFSCVTFVAALYFFIVCSPTDAEAFSCGLPLAIFTAFWWCVIPLGYYTVCKAPHTAFVRMSKDGKIDFSMRIEGDTIHFTNETAEQNFEKPLDQIQRIVAHKDIYILFFRTPKSYMLVSKNEQITALFTEHLSSKTEED